ncbi:MAG: DUF3488 and transglutaminase-like domain-containing protein, partial [Duganella sp.]
IGFPRIQGPLWGLPGDASSGRSGRSGISDSMAPGTLSSLAQSDEVAFRVRFLDPAPPRNQLYWRSIVLGDYDGRTWTRVPRRRGVQARQGRPPRDIAISARGRAIRHEVTMEPTGKRWLALLELTGPRFDVPGFNVRGSDEVEQFTMEPINRRLRYPASAHVDFQLQADEQPENLARWLELPDGFNPRTLALAQQLKQAAPPGARELSRRVLAMFRHDTFSYTLQPPLAGRDMVDDFLFTSKAGFCEHYAGAYVVLMRAMGVPARVVTGYQGGEVNPLDGYLTVRQSDAHAWAEIWIPAEGWRRVDPTGAVAPERIATNLARALPPPSGFGFGQFAALQNDPDSWLAQLGFRYAALNNSWNQWVLDYNPDRQRSFLAELSSVFGNWRSVLVVSACALAYLLYWRRQRRPAAPLDALYQAFCRRQARHGYARRPDEGPGNYAARLRDMPASAEKHAAMQTFLTLYGALKYGGAGSEPRTASLKALKKLLPLCR